MDLRISQKNKLRMCIRGSAFHSKRVGLKVEFCASHWNAEFMSVLFFTAYSAVCNFFFLHVTYLNLSYSGYAVIEIFTLSQWFVDRLPDDTECDHGEKSHGLIPLHAPPPIYYILLPHLHFPALTSSHLSYLTVG